MEVLSICLSDIPKGEMKKADNGKIYCNIVVQKRKEKDKFDNDLTVYMGQTKEQREANEAKAYIGNGRVYEFTGTRTPSAEEIQAAPPIEETEDSGLPF
jgi:hypothetical protein